jgi:hypothetical protein
VANALVKVRGWETFTDSDGKWREEQLVECGALHDHMSSFDEGDQVLIEAPGFVSAEEDFTVSHPAWFHGCERDETVIALETVLQPVGAVKPREKVFAKPAPTPAPESAPAPQPKAEKKQKIELSAPSGGISL